MIFVLFLLVFAQNVFASELVQNEPARTSVIGNFLESAQSYSDYLGEFPVGEVAKSSINLMEYIKSRVISFGFVLISLGVDKFLWKDFSENEAVKFFFPSLVYCVYDIKNIFTAPVTISVRALGRLSDEKRKNKAGYAFAKNTKKILDYSLRWPYVLSSHIEKKIPTFKKFPYSYLQNYIAQSIYLIWYSFLIYNIPPLWKLRQKLPSMNGFKFIYHRYFKNKTKENRVTE